MRKITKFIAFVLIVSATSLVQAKDLPDVLVNGFGALKEVGAKPALEAWIKGSAIEGSKEALSQSNTLSQIGDFLGKYQGYEVVKKNTISSKSNVYLVAMNYEHGILYAKFFTVVLADGKEILQNFKFHTEVEQVWPASVIYGSK